jgi:hypothetical protein
MPEGLVLGVLDQSGYNRKEAKNTTLTLAYMPQNSKRTTR